uniref:NFACT RNA-binding domain-containing protein n=1 Tax=Oryza brachyantha TaxID=4533 RepID=J3KUI7_ORYBR
MVFYFKVRPEAGDYTIFMGLDKFENEDLIKYGFPEDIWFHVDKMSSAHVYLRLNKGQTMDDISEGNKANNIDVVYTPWYNLKKTPSMDVGQVGFHNSKLVRTIKVEKRINEIVNRLNKTKVERKPDLKDISFLNFIVFEEARKYQGPICKKTVENNRVADLLPPPLETFKLKSFATAEREAVSAAEKAERKVQLRDKKRREEMERLEKEKQAEIRSYKNLMVQEKMTSNKQVASGSKSLEELEDDFM